MLFASLWSRMQPRRPAHRTDTSAPASLVAIGPPPLPSVTSDAHRSTIEAARTLPDGTPCDAALLAAIDSEMLWRRTASGTLAGPDLPRFSELVVRHSNVPDWWQENGNLLLCGTETDVEIALGFRQQPCRDCLIVVGSRVTPPRLAFEGEGGLVAIGDGCAIVKSAFNVHDKSSIMVGENTTATFMAMADVRNGGIVVAGDDNMWAIAVNLMTDDTHAIRDAVTDERVNEFGGKIVIERHVWLGSHVQMMGHCHVRHDSVIGQGSFVKNVVVPPQSVAAGRPAKTLRSGITWSRQDLP